jgi:DNA-binding response OmpR family regulator
MNAAAERASVQEPVRVLVVDEEAGDELEPLCAALAARFVVERAADIDDAEGKIAGRVFDVVVFVHALAHSGGVALVLRFQTLHPGHSPIVVSPHDHQVPGFEGLEAGDGPVSVLEKRGGREELERWMRVVARLVHARRARIALLRDELATRP